MSIVVVNNKTLINTNTDTLTNFIFYFKWTDLDLRFFKPSLMMPENEIMTYDN